MIKIFLALIMTVATPFIGIAIVHNISLSQQEITAFEWSCGFACFIFLMSAKILIDKK